MYVPKLIQRLSEPEYTKRLERLKQLKDVTYPLSALEIAELLGHTTAGNVRNWMSGRPIPNYVFIYLTKSKVRSHINHTVLVRKTSQNRPVRRSLRKAVITRLRKDGTEKAIKMLEKLGAQA